MVVVSLIGLLVKIGAKKHSYSNPQRLGDAAYHTKFGWLSRDPPSGRSNFTQEPGIIGPP